jgi:TonB family protein
MASILDSGSVNRQRRRLLPLAISVAVHLTAFFALMNTPEIRIPERSKSEYKQAIEGKEEKLVWYKFKELPHVSPPAPKRENKPLRAEVQAKQEIVASRKDAPKRQQMIYTPAPEIPQAKPVDLPNILAIRMPEVTKPFVAPPDIRKPVAPQVEIAENAPELQTQPLAPVKVADTQRIVKRFTPPPRQVPEKLTEVYSVSNAPEIENSTITPVQLNASTRAITRPFAAPAAPKSGATGKLSLVDAPAPDVVNANSRDLNVAVVGLNPSNVPIALPQSSSPAQFSAGPKVRADGADAAGDGKGISVPDLYVRGAKEAKPDLIAQTFAAPTSGITLRAASRDVQPRNGDEEKPHTASPPGAVKVSSAPDPRFNGRDIYMMAIQMPNLTSYSGSWLMWYSDRTAREVGLAPVAPPVPYRKVDPKYVAAAASERIEGKVQLACVISKDGHVSNVELVRGLDDRLNETAVEALSKWEFTPASRHGEPVAVDVLVEIPFKLAPHVQVRY